MRRPSLSIAASCVAVAAERGNSGLRDERRLLAPQGYETWVFVGSNLGLEYKSEVSSMTVRESERAEQQVFHNIFMDPASYAKFIKTGAFPDPTVLVMELYLAESKDPGGVLNK